MKKITLLLTLVIAAFFAAACGASAAITQTAPPTASVTQGASALGSATEVDVTLADNTINPSLTTFQAGVPYTFVIKNTGNHAHNFIINIPVSVTGSLDNSLASALLSVTQDKLPVGGGTTVEYTFPASAVGMQLEFSCLIKRHYEDGMKLAITVTK